ncbi:MAG: TonB-dependent receptor [Bacteroidota bacterium]
MKKSVLWILLMVSYSVLLGQETRRVKLLNYYTQESIGDIALAYEGKSYQVDGNGVCDIPLGTKKIIQYREIKIDGYTFLFTTSGGQVEEQGKKISIQKVVFYPVIYFQESVVLQGYHLNSSTTTITKGELERDNQLSIAPVLNRVPGVYMHMGTLNTSRLTIRGMGARSLFSTTRVKAYLENIPLTTGDGESTIEDLDLPFIDQVEVIRGPASSLYGAGLGGTIRLRSSMYEYDRNRVSALLQTGSFGLRRASLLAGASDGKSYIKVLGSYLQSEGWRDNNQYERFQAAVLSRFIIDDKSSISFLGTVLDVKGFIPSSIDSATFADNPSSAAFTWNQTAGNEDYFKGLVGLTYMRQLHRNWTFTTSIPISYRANDELRPFNFLRESNLAVGNRTLLEGASKLAGKDLELTLGAETFHEFYAWGTYENIDGLGEIGSQLSDNREERKYINAFASANYAISDKLSLVLGTNFNKTWYTYEDFFKANGEDLSGEYGFEPVLSPRIAASYTLSNNQELSAQISHGFSTPLVSETLTPDGQINPDLLPESGWNYELGWKGRFYLDEDINPSYFSLGVRQAKSFIDASVTVYRLDAINLIVPRRVGNDQFVGLNAGQTRHYGIENSVDMSFALSKQLVGRLWGQYTFMDHRFVDFFDEEADVRFDGNALPGIPKHHGTMGLSLSALTKERKQSITFDINGQLTDGMPLRDDNILSSDAYQVWNAKLTYTFMYKASMLALSGGVQNIFDQQYASMILVNAGSFGGRAPRYFYPAMPRNIFLQLKLDLVKQKDLF